MEDVAERAIHAVCQAIEGGNVKVAVAQRRLRALTLLS